MKLALLLISFIAFPAYFIMIFRYIRNDYLPRFQKAVSGFYTDDTSPYLLAWELEKILRFLRHVWFFLVVFAPPIYLLIVLAATVDPLNIKILEIIVSPYINSRFSLDVTQLSAFAISGLPEQTLTGTISMHTVFPDLLIWHLWAILKYVNILIGFYMLTQLHNIFLSLGNKKVFTVANTVLIKKIAVAFITWNVISSFPDIIGWLSVLKNISDKSNAIKFFPLINLNIQAVIIGIILLILSIVMKQAVKMYEEQRLTI
jgi:hypothetical protein